MVNGEKLVEEVVSPSILIIGRMLSQGQVLGVIVGT